MVYNLTTITANHTGIVGMFQGVNNELLGGMLGIMILLSFAALIFIAFLQTTEGETYRSAAATAYSILVISILLRALSLISNNVLIAVIVLAALAIVVINRAG